MKDYEINRSTLALIPINMGVTKVIEESNEFTINLSILKIIDKSCRYFGSSYLGRILGTKSILGISSKAPIIVEESKKMIFFPTSSPRIKDCIWLSLNNIEKYYKNNDLTLIDFICGKTVSLKISYNIIDNQILRATRLFYLLEERMI